MYFRKYHLQNMLLDNCLKKPVSNVKRAQTLLKSEGKHFYQIYWSLWRELSLEKILLVIFKILKLFVNTLTPHVKYCLLNRDHLTQPNHLRLSHKQKTFSRVFFVFFFFFIFEIYIKFETFSKKRWPS